MLSFSRKSVGKVRLLFLFQTMFFVSLISNSWAQIELPLNFEDGNKISPELLLCSMPYGNFSIDIYEHTDNSLVDNVRDRVYFIAPICLLSQNNPSVSHLGLLNNGLHLGFQVEMWNQDIMNEVADFLTVFYGINVTRGQVHILPVASMVLVTTAAITAKPSITVVPNLYTDHHTNMERQVVDFFVPCWTKVICSHMAQEIRSAPQTFSNIKFYATLNQGGKQDIVLRLKDITSGEMMSTLLGKFEKEVFLTEKDQSRLVAQTTSNIIEKLGLINSNDIIAFLSELDIYSALKDLLVPSRKTVTITTEKDELWQSVFWDNYYRPDNSSRKLNEIYARQPKEVQRNLPFAFSNNNVQLDNSKNVHETYATWFANRVNRSTEGNITTAELVELHHKSVDHVMWEYDKFVPIPVKVTKIDLDKLNKPEKFQEVKLEISSAKVFSSRPILIGHSSSSPKYQARNSSRKSNLNFGNTTQIIQKQVKCVLSHMSLEHSKRKDYFTKQQSKLDEENKKIEQSLKDMENIFEELKRGDEIKKRFDLYLNSLSFHAERNISSRSKTSSILKFTNSSINAGGGFDNPAGRFTAPKPGIYHFYFSAQMVRSEETGANKLTIDLIHTKYRKSSRIVTEGHFNSAGVDGSFPMQMQATVAMATNDTVHVELLEGSIYVLRKLGGDTIFGGFIVN